jgi:hypothetical protein
LSGAAEEPIVSSPSWTFLETFRASPVPTPKRAGRAVGADWGPLDTWTESALARLHELESEVIEEERCWSAALEPLGEISVLDWRRFRPLRLRREEAWSDWLGHLLETSRSGVFAQGLLGRGSEKALAYYALPKVEREVCTRKGEHRADLVIRWSTGETAHVEVKVGDTSFDKTFETAGLLEREYGNGKAWQNFILLPAEDAEGWARVAEERTSVVPLTWTQAAASLRNALRTGAESLSWRTWAHSFCGAVEQRLVGILPRDARDREARSPFERIVSAANLLSVMRGEM